MHFRKPSSKLMQLKRERLEYGKTLKQLMRHKHRMPRLKNKKAMKKTVVVQNLVLPSLCQR